MLKPNRLHHAGRPSGDLVNNDESKAEPARCLPQPEGIAPQPAETPVAANLMNAAILMEFKGSPVAQGTVAIPWEFDLQGPGAAFHASEPLLALLGPAPLES